MSKTPAADGIYAVYFTGIAGVSFAMFILSNGVLAGGDAGGGVYDGEFALSRAGDSWEGAVRFEIPVGHSTITGLSATTEPLRLDVPIKLPMEFSNGQIVRIETQAGPLNVKFVRIRKL